MGISERKAREKEELRTLILNGAMALFAEKGVENVTIRNIAEAVEYSVGTVYVYFKDKNAILHALHIEGFAALRNQFQTLTQVSDPMDRLRASGRLYIEFAAANPDMYDLMFNMKAPLDFVKDCADEAWNEGQSAFDFLLHVVEDCLAAGYFKGHRAKPLAFMIWSTVHGMCHLAIADRTDVVGLEKPVEEGFAELLLILDRS
ncbi:TetR/AcrR family transcriptional regulator [Fibrella sp. WM1]|uniref:TetR/AcrR family transcriptional regulator n=1 Tax=Fibrella musci TaxID=3242485 RepID=UPI0035200EEE